MHVTAPRFGQIYRLVSADGQVDKRYQQACIDKKSACLDVWRGQVQLPAENDPTPVDWDKLCETLYGQVDSFHVENDPHLYLVFNDPDAPCETSRQFLEQSYHLNARAKERFPKEDIKQTMWVYEERRKLINAIKDQAVDFVV